MVKTSRNNNRAPEKYEMDEIDLGILEMLNENARKSFRQMARDLKVSMNTISKRVKAMEDAGIILRYAPVMDSQKLGYDILAIVGVRISKGKQIETENKISRHERVYAVYDITGDWDTIIMARFKNRYELNQFIKTIQSIEYIERTYTQIVLNVVKEETRVLVP